MGESWSHREDLTYSWVPKGGKVIFSPVLGLPIQNDHCPIILLTFVLISVSCVICIFHGVHVCLKSCIKNVGSCIGLDVFRALGLMCSCSLYKSPFGWHLDRNRGKETVWVEMEWECGNVEVRHSCMYLYFPLLMDPWSLGLEGDKVRTVEGWWGESIAERAKFCAKLCFIYFIPIR